MIVSISGGKDSTVVEHMIRDIYALFPHRILFGNTSNETHHTYKYIKEMYGNMNLEICNPREGFYNWCKRTGFIPTKFGRACCSIFKEGNITPHLSESFDKKLLHLCGMRRDESAMRSTYDQIRKGKWENKLAQENWDMYLPIIDFNDLDVWSYILSNELEFNPMYQFNNRCGCSMCPYRSDYELQIAEHYMPTYAKNWKKLIGDIFDSEGLAVNMNCTKEEFLDGAWKAGIVREEPTQEVIEDFAKHKGIDIEQAQKYFKKNRCSCGKRLSKDMIGLNMKLLGRNTEGRMCLKCLAEFMDTDVKSLKNQIEEFKQQKCNLF